MARDDFSPAVRNVAWWSHDTRRAVSGGLVEVIREKRGETPISDISDQENVKWGHRMQPVIGRIFEEETGIGVQEDDLPATHPKEPWLRCHVDFRTSDGGLLEAKNYNGAYARQFSEPDEPLSIPAADYAQCLHEAAVTGVPHVWLAVLFGGQQFRYWKLEFTEQEKVEFLQQAAKWWAACLSGEMPSPETLEQVKAVYNRDDGMSIVADARIEALCAKASEIKRQIKALEGIEDDHKFVIQSYMGAKSKLVSVDGTVLATWMQNKPKEELDKKRLQADIPDTYRRYVTEAPGSRRFLLK